MIDSTNARAAGSVVSLITKSRSILSSEKGVRTSFAIVDWSCASITDSNKVEPRIKKVNAAIVTASHVVSMRGPLASDTASCEKFAAAMPV